MHDRDFSEEQDNVETVIAVGRVHAQLIDHFERVLAPITGVYNSKFQRCVVLAHEGLTFAKAAGHVEDIGLNDLLKEPVEFRIGQLAAIE